MRLSRPIAFAGAAAVLAVAYTGYWLYLADRVRDGIETWVAASRHDGMQVQLGGLTVGGFPFAVTATAMDVRIARPDGLVWESRRVEASARPWWWTRVHLSLPGGQRIELAEVPGLSAAAAAGDGTLRLDMRGRIVGADMTFDTVALALPGLAGLVTIDELAGDWTSTEPEGGGAPVITAELAATAIALPEVSLPDLGTSIAAAGIDLTLTGPPPAALTEQHLAAWRDASGLLSIDSVTLDWGPLGVEGAGTAMLDMALQPEGSLTVDVTGYTALIDAMVAAGRLEERPAEFAKAGLSLLAQPSDEAGGSVLTAPLILRGGILSLGPIQLAAVPPIDWPAE